jgi:hypothetical protein
MTMMNVRAYFTVVVLPLLDRLCKHPSDRDLIFAAAIITYHATDWLADEVQTSLTKVRRGIEDDFADWKYLAAVANTHKHRELNDPKFKGLSSDLSAPQFSAGRTGSGGALRTGSGALVRVPVHPMYEFEDGARKDPVDLIRQSVAAIKRAMARYSI